MRSDALRTFRDAVSATVRTPTGATLGKYDDYCEAATQDIKVCLGEMQVQPILFVGSGLSIRHFGAPSWNDLLEEMVRVCPRLKKSYPVYRSEHGHQIDCAEHFSRSFSKWGTTSGKRRFPDEIHQAVSESNDPAAHHLYLKYSIAKYLEARTPSGIAVRGVRKKDELRALQRISPHTIITTNFDTFLQGLFPEYTPIIGDQILRSRGLSIGEVFQIHGDTSSPPSLVVTRRDYDRFKRRRKYLVAKLLTFFVEHPLLFVGYSHNDPNIREILRDVGELEEREGAVIPNIYIVDWQRSIGAGISLDSEVTIEVDTHRYVRVKRIVARDFTWIYEAFACRGSIGSFRVKPLRALLARVTQLVRKDIPAQVVEVDFGTLQGVLDEDGQLDHILGVTPVGEQDFNLRFRHTLTDVGLALGFPGWHGAKALMNGVRDETGTDVQASDNRYHLAVKTGRAADSLSHKYSDEFIALLRKARDKKHYELDLGFE